MIKKPSKEGLVVDETKTQQLAYTAVKEATGMYLTALTHQIVQWFYLVLILKRF